jgi:AcrR family transcriptional regulator
MAEGKDSRSAIVEAMMRLAAQRRFEEISIRDIAAAAGVSLADFRDAFPSKGAVLAGFSRKIDRAVLAQPLGELANSSARDRLFDVLMRRLDAMAPYRDALRGIAAWVRRDPAALIAINQLTVNSLRFMLEAAELDNDGPAGSLKLQGLALAWGRVFAIWLDDSPPDFAKTMAALDRELTRGERVVAGLDQLDRFAAPLRALMTRGRRERTDAAPAPDMAPEGGNLGAFANPAASEI